MDANDYYLKCEEIRAKKAAERRDRLWDKARQDLLEDDELMLATVDALWFHGRMTGVLVRLLRSDEEAMNILTEERRDYLLDFGED